MLREFYAKVTPEALEDRGAYTVTALSGTYKFSKSLWNVDGLVSVSQEGTEKYWKSVDFGLGSACRYAKAPGPDGEIGVFIEPLVPPCELVICGGGHISLPLAQIGYMLGFKVSVIDDRAFFANSQRFPQATVYCEPFADALEKISGNEGTYFVIVTRGHKYDQDCLRVILPKKSAYTGMIGSRNRVKLIKETLAKESFSQATLDALYSPIGLKIGAQTPEEVAVCILAEIIQVRSAQNRGADAEYELWQRLSEESEFPKSLITITRRFGSAPRQIGTKMIVYADGSSFGTVGGGCMESEARQNAISIAKDGGSALMTLDLTGAAAEDEGMVCGGIVDVLIESIDV